MDCPICIESFNKSTRTKISCKYCQYVTCSGCIKRYLLDSTLEPTCMNCKVAWDSEYIRTIMPKTFLNKEYKIHRENMLLSLEESLMPETQAYASRQKEMARDWDELLKMRDLIKELRQDYNTRYNQYYRKYNNNLRNNDEERRKFILKCPDMNCRGFLSSQYRCGQCEQTFCKDCHALKNNGHECFEDDKKTVELLTTNTKQCPKCSIPIFKIDGCSQMYCVECHTPFDWNTGKIINGVVHNPHYFEWQRRQQNAEPDGQCHDTRIPQIRRFRFLEIGQQDRVTQLIQTLHHIQHVTIPSLNYQENTDEFSRNRDMRIDYLNSNITKEHFKWMIQKRDKAMQKKRLMVMLWQMFLMSHTDLLNNLMMNMDYSEFEKQTAELLKYVNHEITRISKLYSSVKRVRLLNANWQFI